MGAAAVAGRVLRLSTRGRDFTPPCQEPRAPLVGVIGLTGGAGTTSLALNIARHVADGGPAPVLLTELEAGRAGLAVLVGRASPVPLIELARTLDEGDVPGETFIELAPRLRLIASMPAVQTALPPPALDSLLSQARDAHGFVIVDCGTDYVAARPLLDQATNIVWTLPATPVGLASGRALFASEVMPPPGRAREALAAVACARRPSVPARAVRLLAQHRCERAVLVPYSPSILDGPIDDGVARALTGLCSTLRGPR